MLKTELNQVTVLYGFSVMERDQLQNEVEITLNVNVFPFLSIFFKGFLSAHWMPIAQFWAFPKFKMQFVLKTTVDLRLEIQPALKPVLKTHRNLPVVLRATYLENWVALTKSK